jgi:ParB family transcriptional regulator, chromosome partitioning protein
VAKTLKDIPPEQIDRNPENPRLKFREDALNTLAESIDESGGVLVPVYVYPEGGEEERYRLIDGERRWRMALRLGLETIPALVRDEPPSEADNIVEMFNIHKVREDWEDWPTAVALREVMRRRGTEDTDELKQITGLSKEQIGRLKLVLQLPPDYQKMIEDGEQPMNFFVELDRNVIRPLQKSRLNLAGRYSTEDLLRAFVNKRQAGALNDLIDLRRVKPIIQRARVDAGSPDDPSALDGFLERLIEQPETTIDEVYDASVAFAVETDALSAQARALPGQFERLLERAQEGEERNALLGVLRETQDGLGRLLAAYVETA